MFGTLFMASPTLTCCCPSMCACHKCTEYVKEPYQAVKHSEELKQPEMARDN